MTQDLSTAFLENLGAEDEEAEQNFDTKEDGEGYEGVVKALGCKSHKEQNRKSEDDGGKSLEYEIVACGGLKFGVDLA